VVPPRKREPRTRYVVLFLLTLATTTMAGVGHYASFASDLGRVTLDLTTTQLILRGLWYSGAVLLILGAHEFGHYFACRYYGIDASLPYFIPLPLVSPLGTLGAVIRIRQPIPTKRQFFDVGIAGPIAGFIVLVPVLFLAMAASHVVAIPADFKGVEFGEPLLFRLASHLFFGTIPEHHSVNLHPAGWGAWFGMLATALNLAPVGQLDGGHVSYAVFGRRSSAITIGTIAVMLGLLTVSMGYIVWIALLILMMLTLGPHHPRTPDEAEPLDGRRLAVAAFAVAMFVLCFTPVPMELVGF
jgi:membrane-associated protease RseP (regulator of RpoE activity)